MCANDNLKNFLFQLGVIIQQMPVFAIRCFSERHLTQLHRYTAICWPGALLLIIYLKLRQLGLSAVVRELKWCHSPFVELPFDSPHTNKSLCPKRQTSSQVKGE